MNINKIKNNKVVVFAAHPDDEILGAGATFAKLIDQGKEVHAVILCEGESVRYNEKNSIDLTKNAENASSVIGFSSIRFLNMPEQRLDSLSLIDINLHIESILDSLKPDIIFTHYEGDINRDHQIVNETVLVSARPFGRLISEIYAFETPSSTGLWNKYNFNPDTFEIVDEYIDRKIEALKCYKSEILDYPHPRSIEAIRSRAKYWGSIINQEYAEPFITQRRIKI